MKISQNVLTIITYRDNMNLPKLITKCDRKEIGMLDKKIIGDRLKKLRGGRTISEVASACNISPSALSMYENGERIPRDEIKIVLANFYRKTVQAIFYAL